MSIEPQAEWVLNKCLSYSKDLIKKEREEQSYIFVKQRKSKFQKLLHLLGRKPEFLVFLAIEF